MTVRARDLGIPFDGTPGPLNAITDVPGTEVGYVTMDDGDVHTGVTAVLPRGKDGLESAIPAGWFSLNGNGEMTGTAWISETGSLAGPVMITNTHAVGDVHRGVVDWLRDNRPGSVDAWLLPVVAETWDGYLNDINGNHVTSVHAGQAIAAAASGPVTEGSVGGGTGMNCYEFKGGNGTASRLVPYGSTTYTVGVLLQANFGSRRDLRIAGVPVGDLDVPNPLEEWDPGAPAGAGSVIALVATDAPLTSHQCSALARRVTLGLARTGTTGSHFSGDLFLAWSTAGAGQLDSSFATGTPQDDEYGVLRHIPWGRIDDFFAATVHAVEEAVVNALINNADMTGRQGHRSFALPHDQLVERLQARGVLG